MNQYIVHALIAGKLLLATTMTVNAAMETRLNGQAVYDTDQGVTWLSDANYAKSSGYDADGLMTWGEAQTWVSTLNAANHLGFNDWRLPGTLTLFSVCTDDAAGTIASSDATGYNCIWSELGHLFYSELGGVAGNSILTSGDADLALFSNIQPATYWSDTEFAPDLTNSAWLVDFNIGRQLSNNKNSKLFAWAVRPGDVNPGPGQFSDVANSSGITHVNSVTPSTDTGGGVAWIDIDNDNFYDIYIPNPKIGASWLYHNVDDGNGGRVFIEIASITNSDAHNSVYRSTGVAIGDFDNDGCDDIFVTNGGNSGGLLMIVHSEIPC